MRQRRAKRARRARSRINSAIRPGMCGVYGGTSRSSSNRRYQRAALGETKDTRTHTRNGTHRDGCRTRTRIRRPRRRHRSSDVTVGCVSPWLYQRGIAWFFLIFCQLTVPSPPPYPSPPLPPPSPPLSLSLSLFSLVPLSCHLRPDSLARSFVHSFFPYLSRGSHRLRQTSGWHSGFRLEG